MPPYEQEPASGAGLGLLRLALPREGARKPGRLMAPALHGARRTGRRATFSLEGYLTFGLRSSCERLSIMLAVVMRFAPVSTFFSTFSFLETASAVLMPS